MLGSHPLRPYLIGLGIRIFKNFSSDSYMWPGVQTTDLGSVEPPGEGSG